MDLNDNFFYLKKLKENFSDVLTIVSDVANNAGVNVTDVVPGTTTTKNIIKNMDVPDARDVSNIATSSDNIGNTTRDVVSNIDVNTNQLSNVQDIVGNIDINSKQLNNIDLNVDTSIVNRNIKSVDFGAPDLKKIDQLQDQIKDLNKKFDDLSEVDKLKFNKNLDDLDHKYFKLAKEKPNEFNQIYNRIDDLITLKNKKYIGDDDIDFILKHQIFNDDLNLNIDAKKKIKDIKKKYDKSLKCKNLGICSINIDDIDDPIDKKYYKLSLKVREIFNKLIGTNNLWKAATATKTRKLALFLGLLISLLSIAFTGYILAASNKGCKEDTDCKELETDGETYICSKKTGQPTGRCVVKCKTNEDCRGDQVCNKDNNTCETTCKNDNNCKENNDCVNHTTTGPKVCRLECTDAVFKNANNDICLNNNLRDTTCTKINDKHYCIPEPVNPDVGPCLQNDILFKTDILKFTGFTCKTQNTIIIIGLSIIVIIILYLIYKIFGFAKRKKGKVIIL